MTSTVALLSVALAGPVNRVDLLSAGPQPWLLDEAPLAAARPGTAALRLAEQVSVGWTLPLEGLAVGTSWRVQEVRYSRDLGDLPVAWVVGLPTRLLLPVGVRAGLRLRLGDTHLELGAMADGGGSWVAPLPGPLRVTPTLGLGWWTDRRDKGPADR